jgi:hypothetical protein
VEACLYWNVSYKESEFFTVDHVVPKNDTGSIAKGFWPQTITKDYEEPEENTNPLDFCQLTIELLLGFGLYFLT